MVMKSMIHSVDFDSRLKYSWNRDLFENTSKENYVWAYMKRRHAPLP